MLPLILGSDIGSTITALLASMVSDKVEALQVALVHLFFNVTGVLIWYPIPFMRNILLTTSRKLGQITRKWRNFPILFIVIMYFILPLVFMGISACFEQHTRGFTALGIFILFLLVGSIVYFWIWFRFQGGKAKCRASIVRRQRRTTALNALADDMDYLKVDMEYVKNGIGRLKDFAGIVSTAMEEGHRRKPSSVSWPPELVETESMQEEALQPGGESIEDRVSLLDSFHSRSWKNVLVHAAKSVEHSLHASIGKEDRSVMEE
jgi:hypothetical protein